MSELVQGLRVQRTVPGTPPRRGLVVSSAAGGFVDVIPEGSSTGRSEAWPIKQVTPLPIDQQLPVHGGSFQPPKGYPFTLVLRHD